MSIFIDAMGSERGVAASVKGGLQALELTRQNMVFVGDISQIQPILQEFTPKGMANRVDIIPTEEVVTMDEKPKDILRKKNSSMAVAMEQVKNNENSAFVSAGNTGAILALAMFTLGRLPGVDRPCIAIVVPTPTTPVIISDVGANVNCRPIHLFQFALMCDVFARMVYKFDKPRVALMSNGTEEIKGNDLTRAAWKLFKEAESLNFTGYVEGKNIFNNAADIVICDGFVGNIILKTLEGSITLLNSLLKQAIKSNPVYSLGGLLAKGAFKGVRSQLDHSEYGGAPLLGVKGVVMVGHGDSDEKAMKNAILKSCQLVESGAMVKLQDQIQMYQELSLFN